jgi:transcriptional regulator with XRE-family HTH domain
MLRNRQPLSSVKFPDGLTTDALKFPNIRRMAKVTRIHTDKEGCRIHYLREWLERRGTSQAALVEFLATNVDEKTNKGTVSKWCGGGLPSQKYLKPIADFLGLEEPAEIFRHPDEDWMARFFADRPKDELRRMVETMKAAFPRKQISGKN